MVHVQLSEVKEKVEELDEMVLGQLSEGMEEVEEELDEMDPSQLVDVMEEVEG